MFMTPNCSHLPHRPDIYHQQLLFHRRVELEFAANRGAHTSIKKHMRTIDLNSKPQGFRDQRGRRAINKRGPMELLIRNPR